MARPSVSTYVHLSGQKDFIMTANFGLPSVGAENRDAYMKAPAPLDFE